MVTPKSVIMSMNRLFKFGYGIKSFTVFKAEKLTLVIFMFLELLDSEKLLMVYRNAELW